MIRPAPGELDSELFEKLAAATRRDDTPAATSSRLEEALAFWNGAVLDGIETDVPGRIAATRLEELGCRSSSVA